MMQNLAQDSYLENQEKNRLYFLQVGKTIKKVQQLMHEAWPNAGLESTDDIPDIKCYNLAVRILVIKEYNLKRKREAGPKITPLLSAAKKFQKELSSQRAALGKRTPPNLIEYYQEETNIIEEALKSVSALLDLYKPWSPYPGPAKEIAEGLLEIWSLMSLDVSIGKKADDPLCKAVQALLAESGLHYELDTVSDMLRGREKRPRSGQAAEGGRKNGKNPPRDAVS
jgi:hypothetical protein